MDIPSAATAAIACLTWGGGNITFTLNNVVMTGGSPGSNQRGGALQSYAGNNTITVNDSVFHGNSARDGGAISFTSGGSLSINRSAFYDNTATRNGGVFWNAGTLTVTNSTFYNNSAGAHGGVFAISTTNQHHTRLRHNTITGNRANQGGGFYSILGEEHLHNNIIWGNTATFGTSADCGRNVPNPRSALNTNVGNIIGVSTCTGGGTTFSTADPKLAASASGHPPFYILQTGSPAIDAVACLSGVAKDQRDKDRPYGSQCDIGAYEWYPPPPPPPPRDDPPGSDEESSSSSSVASASDDQAPAAVIIPTCLSLPSHISVSNITHLTQCQQVNAAGIGNAAVLDLGFRDGVDVWGWVLHDTQVCFEGSSGSFRFLDAATAPRAVSELPAFLGENGMICATIDRAGTVALVNGPPVPAPSPTPPVYQSLSGCMVTTTFILNLRAAPAGDVIGAVPYSATLTALERTDSWFKVDYHGAQGWISAAYVSPEGDCG